MLEVPIFCMFLRGASRHLHNECSREREEFMYGNLHQKVSILNTLVFRRKSAFEFKYAPVHILLLVKQNLAPMRAPESALMACVLFPGSTVRMMHL